MKQFSSVNRLIALALATAGVMASVGCEGSGAGGSGAPAWGSYILRDEAGAPVAAAPKAAEPAKPAPKAAEPAKPASKVEPAPAAKPVVASSGGSFMAFPTGDRNTSVISIERFMPRQVIAGSNFDYSMKVCNLTSNKVSGVVLRDECAPTMNVVSSNPAHQGGVPTLTWNLGDFNPGECKTVTVTAKAGASGSMSSCATVTWAQMICQTIPVVQPALKVELTQTPAEATPCDQVCIKVVVSNPGTADDTNVKVNVPLCNGFTSTDGKSGPWMWDVGTLAAGASKEMTICGKISKTGQCCNTATATADNNLTATSQQGCTVVKQPVLALTAQCPPGGITGRGGRNLTFSFTVTNKGDAACSTTVTAPVPTGTSFVSADNGGTNAGGNVSWNVGNLAPGASKTVSLVAKAASAGNFAASAAASCACAAPVQANCSTALTSVPDIGTQITDDDGVIDLGQNHTFRYEVRNQGFSDLTNVKVVMTLDDGLDFVSTDGPGTAQGKTVTFNVGTVKAGQAVRFNIVCKGTKAGELVIQSVTTSDQTKPVRNDEQVNYVQ
jgi:uncharacterized repeat protein (TIGR01451 family)